MFRSASGVVSILFALALSPLSRGQGVITTVAGSEFVFRGDGQPAVNASLGPVGGVAVDSDGNVFACDRGNHLVVKISRDGILTVVAGNGLAGFSGDGGPATSARLSGPLGVAVDSAGNLYIADGANVRKVTLNGTITTVAGGGSCRDCEGVPATSVFLYAAGVAVDAGGNIYIAGDRRIRKVDTNGLITTVAGGGPLCSPPQQPCGGDGGPAIGASLYDPPDVAVDTAGNLYILERDSRVRKVDSGGTITTVAGTPLRIAPFRVGGTGVAVDVTGNLYITSTPDGRVVKVTAGGSVSTIAGTGTEGYSGDGGPAVAAALDVPDGVAVDTLGNVYLADRGNFRIRKVNAAGTISTIAGRGDFKFAGDGGPAVSAAHYAPYGLAFDQAGNLFISDTESHRIRRVNPAGLTTTIAGTGLRGYSGDGGPGTSAMLYRPESVAVDPVGNVYIADTWNFRIRKISPDGRITTAAGRPPLPPAGLTLGLALDSAGQLYYNYGHQVARLNPGGGFSVVAGTGDAGFSGDGGPATAARLAAPYGVAVDAAGNVYIADTFNHRVRKVDRNGTISTVAGNGVRGFSGDGGLATNAALSSPRGLAVDATGNIYIGDGSYRIRKVSAAGVITRFAGTGFFGFSGDGGEATAAAVTVPTSIATDAAGNVYFADPGNDRIRAVLAAAPSFQAAPASLTFSARSGGAPPPAQQLNLTSSTPGVPFSVAVTAPWLQASPTAGTMPTNVQITADPSALAPGAVQALVTITAPNANPPVRTVAVTFNVDPARPPLLGVDPAGVSFSFRRGSGSATSQLTVSNRGDGPLNFTASATTTSGRGWLSVTPSSGSVTATRTTALAVTANPAGLDPGTYTGLISISSSTAGGEIHVPVTMTISGVSQTILLSQTGLTFTAVADGGTVPPQSFGVLNTGQGVMNWMASASTLLGGSGWLAVSPASGATDAGSLVVPLVDVAVNAAGLAPGSYYGQVQVPAPAADNSPQFVSVVLNVLPPGSNPGAVVRPTGLIFTGVTGGINPGSQNVAVSNVTATPISFASNRLTYDGVNWFTHIPTNATVDPVGPARLVVQPDIGNLTPGVRRGVLTLLFQDGAVRTVNTLLVLIAGPPGNPRSLRVEQAACAPTKLLPVFTSLGSDFNVPAAWPIPLEVRVVDDCAAPLAAGSVVATFSNGDPALQLVSLRDGRWSGTWQPSAARLPQVTITVSAEVTDLKIQGVAQVTGGLQANATPPVLIPGGIVSAASLSPRAPLAPGSIVSIFGARLSEGQSLATRLPLETQLAGTLVTIGGRPLPLLFASEGQINAMLPFDVPVNTRHQLIVRRGGSYTVPEAVVIAAAQPAIFTKDQNGKGQGIILDSQNRFAEPANPVRAGDAIVIYCSGLGLPDPPVPAGSGAPSSPLATTVNPVTLTIGGVRANVFFAGLAPGFAGLYQVNAFVPQGVMPGSAVPVVLTVAGQDSPPVSMAVR